MKHYIFRYIAIAATLLATAVSASAQYNITNGVGTSKKVTQLDAESYKIRLETFATGTTTVTETATPVDVVLVLDVSGSMDYSKGTPTRYNQYVTYDDVLNGNQTYFVLNNNNYERVWARTYREGNQTYYELYRYPANPQRITRSTSRTQCRSNQLYVGTSRMQELQKAVGTFIEDIERDDHQDKDGNEREERLGNRISIVKFASNSTNNVGNDTYYENPYTQNNSQIVMNLTNVEGNVETMKAEVNAFQSMGGTQAGYGMNHAVRALANADADHNKVVVFFTDGNPDDNFAAIGNANNGGSNAYRIKNSLDAVVYTIGMFTTSPASNSNTYQYLNYVSSNYPTATVNNGNMNQGTGGSNQGYYQDASGDVDLTEIFKSISSGIGGATKEIGQSTQVRDIVTNSFVLPSTVSAADVHVYTSAASGDATSGDDTLPPTWGTETEITSSVGITIENVDANGNPIDDEDTTTPVANKALFVTGFDYSKDDTTEGQGDGNWVGPRYKNSKYTFAGKKLIIEFTVKADPEATGGETLTNTGKSGVYLKNDDGSYTCINNYEQPHQTLTVNIKIRKTGLRHGESATFELMRIRPKNWDDSKTLEENKANIEYNIIGKPIPGTKTPSGSATQPDQSDYYESMGWEGFKKIILTNKGENGAEVVKEVLVLDPYWVYMVLEDDWGWAYTMTGDTQQVGDDGTYTTSSVEVNPFRFHNTENADAVKHAEAIMINHFKGSESASKVEHEKSSKVEHF